MQSRILITNNLEKAISYTSRIQEICRPLFSKTKISYFNFSRKYFDGSNLSLTTHPDWLRAYYQLGLHDPCRQ